MQTRCTRRVAREMHAREVLGPRSTTVLACSCCSRGSAPRLLSPVSRCTSIIDPVQVA